MRAKTAIENIIKTHDISSKVKNILVPKRDVVEVVKGKKVKRSKNIYPGYVFIQMILDNDVWHLIRKASTVIHFVGGTKMKPLEVSQEQIQAINEQVEDSLKNPQAHVSFSEGETVLVIDGPFKNFNGVVEEVNQEKARVKVSVSIFGRPTPVEFDFSQVHKES